MGRLAEKHLLILRFVADQPSGSCRVNWLPTDIDFVAYRELRDQELLLETVGRGGFTEVAITTAGRATLEATNADR